MKEETRVPGLYRMGLGSYRFYTNKPRSECVCVGCHHTHQDIVDVYNECIIYDYTLKHKYKFYQRIHTHYIIP
jgi:hypothetical protein